MGARNLELPSYATSIKINAVFGISVFEMPIKLSFSLSGANYQIGIGGRLEAPLLYRGRKPKKLKTPRQEK